MEVKVQPVRPPVTISTLLALINRSSLRIPPDYYHKNEEYFKACVTRRREGRLQAAAEHKQGDSLDYRRREPGDGARTGTFPCNQAKNCSRQTNTFTVQGRCLGTLLNGNACKGMCNLDRLTGEAAHPPWARRCGLCSAFEVYWDGLVSSDCKITTVRE